MDDQQRRDDLGGLTAAEDAILTIWLWLAQASPEQLRQFAELTKLADR
jgi:hypothetical protein